MSQRLFVGNLPYGVTSEDLKQEFNAYGEVKNVEIKTKENLVDPDNPNVFAFVTIDISRQMITQCNLNVILLILLRNTEHSYY